MTELETLLNDASRTVLIRENYDFHFAPLEQRVLVETRLFLARWEAICRHAGLNPQSLLPLAQPRRRNAARGITYTEIARGEFLGAEPARPGASLIAYRDDRGGTWVRTVAEYDNGRYE
jgi:hypothetical protein